MFQKTPELDMSLEGKKRDLPAQLPYINTLDIVAEEFGSKDEFVNACRISTAPSVMTFVRIAETCPDMELAEVCVRAELAPDKLLELVVPALYRWNASVSKLLIALNQPKTVRAGIESAQIPGPEGFADRKVQYQMGGLLGKDSAQTQVNVNIGDLESFEDNVVDITPRKVQEVTDVQS